MKNIKVLAKIFADLRTGEDIRRLMLELFTQSELNTLSKRWQILNLLNQKRKQRDIAAQLQVSLCKVTRGSKILKKTNTIVKKYLDGDKANDNNIQKNTK